MRSLALLALLALCSCFEHKRVPRPSPPPPPPEPTDVTYYFHRGGGSGDYVPVQIIRLRMGTTFIVIGTDTHGTPIILKDGPGEWKRQ